MPRRDGTGPMGREPSTGRGFGFCNVGRVAQCGMGLSLGLGLGLANRHRFRNRQADRIDAPTKERLTQQKELLEQRLEAISNQLKSL